MKKIMAVVTAEAVYAERFSDYVNGSGTSTLRAKPFPSVEAFLGFRKEHGPDSVPVLLCDEELIGESRGFDFSGSKVLLLSESKGAGTLGKYQSGPSLLRDILFECAERGLSIEAPPDRRKLQIYTIWGTAGSTGRLLFSLALCRMLSRRKKTVYMDLRAFSGMKSYTGRSYERGLSTAVYYLRQGKLDGQRLTGLFEDCGGISYLPPVASAEDLEMMSVEDRNRIFAMLAEETPVECVVADIPDSLAAQMDILEMSEKIFLISSNDPVGRASLEMFRETLRNAGRGDLLEKIEETDPPAEPDPVWPKGEIDGVIYSETGDRVRRALGI